MRRLLVLLLVLTASPLALSQQEMPEVARSLMEEAERARDAGRVDDAIEKFTRVIEVAPQLASAYVNLGALQHKQGKIDEAFATFARGVERAPADRTLLSNAAAAAQQLGKSAEALGYVDRALERNRRDAALHSLRATILRAMQRDADALGALQQAVQLEPRDSRIHFSLGNLLYALGKKDDAINAYRKSADLDRSFLRAYYNLGAVLFEAGRYDEALKAYKVALEPIEQTFAKGGQVEAIHGQAYSNLGAIYLRQQQWQPAADAYSKALRLDPENAAAHYNLGFIFFSTNRFDPAAEEYREALELDPNLPLAYLHLGQMAYRRGDHAGAVEILTKGKSRFEGASKIDALQTLGRAELARGNRSGAGGAFEEILRDQPNDVDALVYLGRIYRQEQRTTDAQRVLDQAQRVAPDNRQAMLERALLARAAGDLAQERLMSEKILEKDPNRAELWPLRANLALILLRQNNLVEARKALDAAIASAPANQATTAATLRSVRALLLARDRQFAEAQRDVAGGTGAVAAIVDALAGKRDNAVRLLQELSVNDATLKTDLGLLLWQMGRGREASALLGNGAWTDATVAAGEIALAAKDYDRAIDLLAPLTTCAASTSAFSVNADALEVTLGGTENLCARGREAYTMALLHSAAVDLERYARDEPSASALRQSRQLVDRALALSLKDRVEAAAHFLKASFELLGGATDAARDSLAKATRLGLSPQADAAAKRYLATIRENEDAQREPDQVPEPSSPTPRRVVAVFLPDVPADDKKIAEAIAAMTTQLSSVSGVPLETEFFRRDDNAGAFVATNRQRVGVLIANPEFVTDLGGFRPRFQFTRDGRQTYRRVVIVPTGSDIKTLADLRGRSISMVDGLRDATGASGTVVTRVPDDLTAAANALYGKTDAALVAEANPLLAQNESKLRVIHTTGAFPLPVIAFAPMPTADREALTGALRSATVERSLGAIQMSGLASLDPPARERPAAKKIEVASVPLGLTYTPGLPASVTYRLSLRLPEIAIPEE